MGQEKQRGTFEQRKAEAVERNREIAKLRRAYEETHQDTKKTSVTTTAMLGLAVAAMATNMKGGA